MSARRPLDVIQVPSPCPADWEKMSGDEQRRFCAHCGKHVHNLTAMPADEAERLICERAGDLCVRFARDIATGAVITLDYARRPQTSRRRAILVIASILAAMGFSAAWIAHRLLREPDPVQMQILAGAIAPLPRPATPSK